MTTGRIDLVALTLAKPWLHAHAATSVATRSLSPSLSAGGHALLGRAEHAQTSPSHTQCIALSSSCCTKCLCLHPLIVTLLPGRRTQIGRSSALLDRVSSVATCFSIRCSTLRINAVALQPQRNTRLSWTSYCVPLRVANRCRYARWSRCRSAMWHAVLSKQRDLMFVVRNVRLQRLRHRPRVACTAMVCYDRLPSSHLALLSLTRRHAVPLMRQNVIQTTWCHSRSTRSLI